MNPKPNINQCSVTQTKLFKQQTTVAPSIQTPSSYRVPISHSISSRGFIDGMVPYTLFGLITLCSTDFSSTLPKTSSKCSPSPSSSRIVRIRTGSLNMPNSVMPAQVLRSAVVGGELTARAVTSAMESQQVDEIPEIPA